jgi:hypothetical protein
MPAFGNKKWLLQSASLAIMTQQTNNPVEEETSISWS